jgi:hypothetical protein
MHGRIVDNYMETGRGRAYLLITVLLHRSTIRFDVRGPALDL